jgi:hypothetical protein
VPTQVRVKYLFKYLFTNVIREGVLRLKHAAFDKRTLSYVT